MNPHPPSARLEAPSLNDILFRGMCILGMIIISLLASLALVMYTGAPARDTTPEPRGRADEGRSQHFAPARDIPLSRPRPAK